ncbi:hypothetical protein QQP08_022490 [Theobroma cacao]|nr:hypothetical protein QQP08_022490 [Theobroma cacao]
MAYLWHDIGGIWICCTLQWFLADTGSVYAEDTNPWLAVPTTIHQIGMFSLKVNCLTDIGVSGCLYNPTYQRKWNKLQASSLVSLCRILAGRRPFFSFFF